MWTATIEACLNHKLTNDSLQLKLFKGMPLCDTISKFVKVASNSKHIYVLMNVMSNILQNGHVTSIQLKLTLFLASPLKANLLGGFPSGIL